MSAAAPKPLWGHCRACGHLWRLAELPGAGAPLIEAAECIRNAQANSHCPHCGNPGYLARQRDGVLLPQDPVAARSGARR